MPDLAQTKFAELVTRLPPVEVQQATKEEILRELLVPSLTAGHFTEEQIPIILRKLMQRENHATTGIGQGIAVPHARVEFLPRNHVIFGRSQVGVHWESLDAEPVHLWLVLLSPVDQPREHLRIMESWSRVVRQDDIRLRLRTATQSEIRMMWET